MQRLPSSEATSSSSWRAGEDIAVPTGRRSIGSLRVDCSSSMHSIHPRKCGRDERKEGRLAVAEYQPMMHFPASTLQTRGTAMYSPKKGDGKGGGGQAVFRIWRWPNLAASGRAISPSGGHLPGRFAATG